MIRAEIDKGPYEPKKVVKFPYLGVTQLGTLLLVQGDDPDEPDMVIGIVLRSNHGRTESAGYEASFSSNRITPLEEGKSVTLSNTWELADE